MPLDWAVSALFVVIPAQAGIQTHRPDRLARLDCDLRRNDGVRAIVGVLVALLLLFALTASPAAAREEILRFDSAIEVEPGGALLVEETITVRAEGDDIRRGIYRDLPIRYPGNAGLVRRVGFELLEVRRDGRPEPHFTEYIGDFVRIYAGEQSVFLEPGEYTYTLRYRTTRQLRHFEDHDEVYWNATGNFWTFPIRDARATVTLPDGARIIEHAAYTGRFGEKGRDYIVASQSQSTMTFETTRVLAPGEGLSVAVAFPKGVVAEPGGFWPLWDNLGLLILALAAAGTGTYYYTIWHRVGRDPQRGVIIPLFSPPAGLSPAAVSYVHYQGFSDAGHGTMRGFIAALMSLAVKRLIRISDDDGTVALDATDSPRSKLPGGETAVFDTLLGGRKSFAFEKANGTMVQKAQKSFRSAILREHEGVFFRTNYPYFLVGAVISAAALAAYVVLARPGETDLVILAVMFAAAAGGSLLLSMGSRRVLGWLPGGGSMILGVLLAFAGSLVIVLLVGALVVFAEALPTLPAALVVAIAMVNVAFFHLLRAPTIVGRKVMDDIEGFRLYLSVAEGEWMNMAEAPDMSAEVFERYLPYAVALGVEKPWSEAFQRHLARVMPGAEPGSAYRPVWYHGAWSSRSLGQATSAMVASISSSMAAAMPSQTSSGSGGGGFSGGGGGGGGGGGW